MGAHFKYNHIPQLGEKILTGVDNYLSSTVLPGGQQTAQTKVAVDTGLTRSTIQIIRRSKGKYTLSVGKGIKDIRAFIIEFGRFNKAPRPYMLPATDTMFRLANTSINLEQYLR